MYPDDYWLMAEASGNPESYHPMNEYQKANLRWWDNEIERLVTQMREGKELMLEQRRKSDDYQMRTIKELH